MIYTNIQINIGICLGNSHGNFQLHRFTTSENITKSLGGGYFFDSHCIEPLSVTIIDSMALVAFSLSFCSANVQLLSSNRNLTRTFFAARLG